MNLLTLAWRNLRRRPARSLVVTLSVGLAIASALSLVALSDSIEHGAHEGVDERGADLTVLQRDASDVFSGFIPEDTEARAAKVDGIAGTTGELVTFASVGRDRQRLIVGWSDDSFFWQAMPIGEGRLPASGERRVAVLGATTAESLGKGPGDDIEILGERFKVTAIAGYRSALNRSLVIVPLADLQEISFKSGQVTILHLKLREGLGAADRSRIQRDIQGLGRLTVTPTDQLLRNDRNLLVLKAISRSITFIALTLGALSVLNALLMAVQERTREIGIMMAIGWSKLHTITSIVIEGALIGVGGSAVGLVLGYVATFSFSSIPQIGNYLSFSPKPGLILPTLLVAVAMCALGSLYPAWRATARTPAEAIRGH